MDFEDKKCFDIVSTDEKVIGDFLKDEVENIVIVNGDSLLCFDRGTLLREYVNNEEKWYYECVLLGHGNEVFVSMPVSGSEKVLVKRVDIRKSLGDTRQQVFHMNFVEKKNMVSQSNAGLGSAFCQEGLNLYEVSYCDGESCWESRKMLNEEKGHYIKDIKYYEDTLEKVLNDNAKIKEELEKYKKEESKKIKEEKHYKLIFMLEYYRGDKIITNVGISKYGTHTFYTDIFGIKFDKTDGVLTRRTDGISTDIDIFSTQKNIAKKLETNGWIVDYKKMVYNSQLSAIKDNVMITLYISNMA
jgi:hypothetical protein